MCILEVSLVNRALLAICECIWTIYCIKCLYTTQCLKYMFIFLKWQCFLVTEWYHMMVFGGVYQVCFDTHPKMWVKSSYLEILIFYSSFFFSGIQAARRVSHVLQGILQTSVAPHSVMLVKSVIFLILLKLKSINFNASKMLMKKNLVILLRIKTSFFPNLPMTRQSFSL